ncbi:MAG: class I SAM-dependent methyltransferase [Patescibacteria group bacterium]
MEPQLKIVDKLVAGKERVLELGCGNGKLINGIAAAYPHLKAIIGVDFYNAPPVIDPRVQFIKQDLENLSIEGTFDLIILNHVFEHIKNPLGLVERIKKNLAPRGKLLIIVPNRRGFQNEARTYLPEHGKHYFLWDRESLEYSLNRLGMVCRFHNLHFTSTRGNLLKFIPALLRIENPNLMCIAAMDVQE